MTKQYRDNVIGLTSSRTTRLIALATGVGILGTGVASLVGLPLWVFLAMAAVPWLIVVRQRRGAAFAVGSVASVLAWILLVILVITGTFHLPMLLTVTLAVTLMGIVGVVLLVRIGAARRPSRLGVLTFVPALAGPLAWLTLVASTWFVSSVARFSWVMSGDSPNNLLFARSVTSHSGILLGPEQNPVPLPTALLAIFMAPGRGSVSSSNLVLHDLLSFEQLWALAISLVCFLAGLVAASIIRAATDRPFVVAIVAAAGSLLPISWLAIVYPVDYGFFGSHIALIVLFASLIVYQGSRRSPYASVGLLAIACTLLLSIWSPLVLIPAALAAAVVVQDWRTFRAARGRVLIGQALCLAQLVVYGVGVVVPSFLQQKQFLSASGASYLFPPPLVFILIGIALVCAFVTRRTDGWRSMIGILALAVGSLVGLEALLINSARGGDGWTYYPSKFAWTIIVVFIVVVIGSLPATIAPYFVRAPLSALAILLVMVIAAAVAFTVPHDDDHPSALPVNWILNREGDATAATIVRSADLEHPTLYWQSSLPNEQFVNFWLIEVASRSVSNVKLRSYAYSYRENSVKDLCTIVRLMGGKVTVKTSNPALAPTVARMCASADTRVTLRG